MHISSLSPKNSNDSVIQNGILNVVRGIDHKREQMDLILANNKNGNLHNFLEPPRAKKHKKKHKPSTNSESRQDSNPALNLDLMEKFVEN